jgi:hypothetical protein
MLLQAVGVVSAPVPRLCPLWPDDAAPRIASEHNLHKKNFRAETTTIKGAARLGNHR